jgi:hypothetical protein
MEGRRSGVAWPIRSHAAFQDWPNKRLPGVASVGDTFEYSLEQSHRRLAPASQQTCCQVTPSGVFVALRTYIEPGMTTMRTHQLISAILKAFPLAVLPAIVGGCVSTAEQKGSTPVPLNVVLQSLQRDLSRTHPLTLSNIRDNRVLKHFPRNPGEAKTEPEEVQHFREAVANLQCYDVVPSKPEGPKESKSAGEKKGKTPKAEAESPVVNPDLRQRDPLVPFVTGALQLAVQGSFSTQGGVTFTVPASVSFQVQRQAQQQIMLPTSLVSLPNVPVFFLGQQLSSIQYADKLDDYKKNAQITGYISRTLETMNVLQRLIDQAHEAFDSAATSHYCDGRDDGLSSNLATAVLAFPAE